MTLLNEEIHTGKCFKGDINFMFKSTFGENNFRRRLVGDVLLEMKGMSQSGYGLLICEMWSNVRSICP